MGSAAWRGFLAGRGAGPLRGQGLSSLQHGPALLNAWAIVWENPVTATVKYRQQSPSPKCSDITKPH